MSEMETSWIVQGPRPSTLNKRSHVSNLSEDGFGTHRRDS